MHQIDYENKTSFHFRIFCHQRVGSHAHIANDMIDTRCMGGWTCLQLFYTKSQTTFSWRRRYGPSLTTCVCVCVRVRVCVRVCARQRGCVCVYVFVCLSYLMLWPVQLQWIGFLRTRLFSSVYQTWMNNMCGDSCFLVLFGTLPGAVKCGGRNTQRLSFCCPLFMTNNRQSQNNAYFL